MRALVTRPMADRRREKVLVDDWRDPGPPTGDQVRTRTVFTGITNGTERNDLVGGNYAHPDEALPAGWGYQNVGAVVEAGPDVRRLRAGDVLYLSQDHVEYCVASERSLLVKLPEGVDPIHAALFGMASVAMHSCRHAELRMGQRFLVVGAGVVGQAAAQVGRAMGARVTLVDVDPRRLEVARRIGAAEEVLDVSGDGWDRCVHDLQARPAVPGCFDAVLDVAGVPGMEDRLLAAARVRGTVLFIAGRDRVSYTFNQGQGREITIRQNSHFDQDDLENLCRLVDRRLVDLGPLVRDVVPVAQAKAIYDTLRDDPNQLLGTVFRW